MRGGERVSREGDVSKFSGASHRDGRPGTPWTVCNARNGPPMNKEVTICLRIDEKTARRIENVLNSDCPTRSRFIRAAIEKALSQEEGRARLQSAYSAISWD